VGSFVWDIQTIYTYIEITLLLGRRVPERIEGYYTFLAFG
jgi:hypothetical protein